MAVCLLSMSALYVVDWHHRNYGIHSIDGKNRTGIEEVPKGDGGLGMMKKTIVSDHFIHYYLVIVHNSRLLNACLCRNVHKLKAIA